MIVLLVACGDNIRPEEPDDPVYICGNGVLDPGEDCDDDDTLKDTVCDATCHFTCGNGVVDGEAEIGEQCDTGIASGPGACPSSCDDGAACTDDVLSGSECTAVCVHSEITARVTGDGCCPVGADATMDGDCSSVCGNGIVESGEVCDTGIVAGAGACPAACDDLLVCTTNVLSNMGTCQAACNFPPITMPASGDGCCPAGANATNDNDCVAMCGNGVVEPGEVCDTGIATGAGKCPSACDDGVACTANVLGNAGTCQAVCVFPPIVNPANGDGCCPAGANASNDNDCVAMCGNSVVEPGEVCDTGIATGAGKCPTVCDDNLVCTTNVLSNMGTCQAACSFPPIVNPANGDGCCPAGANSTNDNDCVATCGNGVFEPPSETCDTGITSGAGRCPITCNDGVACTSNVLGNPGTCQAVCVFPPIVNPANGDGCCPAGANAANDNDCVPVCGNGVVEPGEVCDLGIATGAGKCPTVCDDLLACTTNVLSNVGTCQATCSFPPITMPANGDSCCPAGANATNDNDCIAACGNGVVEPPSEICDTGISTGVGRCPTTCDDGVACTANVLGNGGTCQATCVFPPITTPANGDGCCPAGANATNDNDCVPVCGNGVPEPGEQCDDANTNNTDACANNCTTNTVATAFRFSDLDLRDPHVFYSIIGCNDLTDASIFYSVNTELQNTIQQDADGNGILDLSPTLVFRPFSQTAATMPLELHFATCTAPIGSTTCTATTGGTVAMGTATNVTSGTCLAPIPGTIKPYTPAIVQPTAPCFVSNAVTVTIVLSGIPITLTNAQVAARYVGNPATSLSNGLLRGFISEADANATLLPASIPIVGGQPLSKLLPGGAGACPSYSDKDVNNAVTGWWFYMNFPATRVPWN